VTKLLYRGSVKDLIGPIALADSKPGCQEAMVFDYSDAFSVFDWGRMPDILPRKGEALAVLAASLFEKLEKPESWREFSRSSEALGLRKANRFGAIFNEVGEELQSVGLRTHYLGGIPSKNPISELEPIVPKRLPAIESPLRRIVVQPVTVVKPQLSAVLGRVVPDYHLTRTPPLPRLVPLEFVFRLSCPEGSSLKERANRDPNYLTSLGFPGIQVGPHSRWDFPILELFTKLENTDRPISLGEALAISGLSASQLQNILFKTAWVAGLLKYGCNQLGLELADGKLEWAIDATGESILIDAIGPDELRILKDGIQLSKEFLRGFYRKSQWYEQVEQAKTQAKIAGSQEWKKWVRESPPLLPTKHRDLAIQVYLALTNELSGRKWFPEAYGIQHVVEELKLLHAGEKVHA
jgi:phosphoribosylaminoimidazole-succinocarboxamide synthase